MKNKDLEAWRNHSIGELEQREKELRNEIARLRLSFKINPPKDTNILVKKRKELAVILTIITEKKMAGKL